MCGICGIFNKNGKPVTDGDLRPMLAPLHHRGPDSQNLYCEGSIGLGHTRLSIIDVSGGTQPIHNEDKSVWVSFNGEIFNFIELRQDLEKAGHQFYTQSDTEVIVHAYEEFGLDFVHQFNGQFAIALWDSRRQQLVLARDRVGIHPLFYFEDKDRIYFASEVKSILSKTGTLSTNLAALDQMFTFWAPVSPQTLFDGIKEVSPGHLLVVKADKSIVTQYWDWQYPEHGQFYTSSEQEQIEQLHELLIDATTIRLRSDVPVGAYLSGGLDSSVITALIHQYGKVPLRTFSLGFDSAEFDETSYQQQLIKHLDAEHSSIKVDAGMIAANFQRAIQHTEMPIIRTAPVPMMLLSGLVREHGYKVVLTGEGSDEVLGGYDIFKETKIRQFWSQNVSSQWRPILLKRLYPYLDITKNQGRAYLEQFFGVGIDKPGAFGFSHLTRWITTSKIKDFYSDDMKAQLQGNAEQVLEQSLPAMKKDWHYFNKAQYLEVKTLMGGYLLCSQGDRMLMANSVEGRFPFLDHRVMEFASGLHPRVKMKALNEKYILKQAMKKYLPSSITARSKQPYRAPDIPSFFSGGNAEYVDDLFSENRLQSSGYFHPKRAQMLLKKIRNGRAIGYKDNMAFMAILSTQLWHSIFHNKTM